MEQEKLTQVKKCSRCKEELSLSNFRIRTDTSTPENPKYTSQCFSCMSLSSREKYQRNKESYLERSRVQKNKPYYKDWEKEYRLKNKESHSIYCKAQYLKNKDDPEYKLNRKNYWNKYYQDQDNRNHVLLKSKQWRDDNLERAKELEKSWRLNNPHKVLANTNKRRATKLQSVPNWVNDIYVKDVYYFAEVANKKAPGVYNVDHIVPLVSDYVCGLHWEGNLQILTAIENASKSNRYWPQMNEITPELKALAKQFKKDNVNKTD